MFSGYARTGQIWRLLSPSDFKYVSVGARYVVATGNAVTNGGEVIEVWGVRPAIVLKPGIEIASGDGTYNSPYVIDTTSS
jgi:hypothetical protein